MHQATRQHSREAEQAPYVHCYEKNRGRFVHDSFADSGWRQHATISTQFLYAHPLQQDGGAYPRYRLAD